MRLLWGVGDGVLAALAVSDPNLDYLTAEALTVSGVGGNSSAGTEANSFAAVV